MLYNVLIDPFVQMGAAPDLFVQTIWEGLVAGVLYALIALGFVLIFKASGVFNFAQGIMVVFAALTLVGLHEKGVPPWIALLLTLGVMAILAIAWSASCCAPGEPAGHHPLHGNLRPDLHHHRPRRIHLRR